MKKLTSHEDLAYLVFICFLTTILFVLPILNIFPDVNSLISGGYTALIRTAFFGFFIFLGGCITSLLLIPNAGISERLWLSMGLSLGLILTTILLISLFQSILPIPSQIDYYLAIAVFIALWLAVTPKRG